MRTGVTKYSWLPGQRPGRGSFPPPAAAPALCALSTALDHPGRAPGDITPEDTRTLVLVFTKPLSLSLWVSGEGSRLRGKRAGH